MCVCVCVCTCVCVCVCRLATHGFEPVVGDLVYAKEGDTEAIGVKSDDNTDADNDGGCDEMKVLWDL